MPARSWRGAVGLGLCCMLGLELQACYRSHRVGGPEDRDSAAPASDCGHHAAAPETGYRFVLGPLPLPDEPALGGEIVWLVWSADGSRLATGPCASRSQILSPTFVIDGSGCSVPQRLMTANAEARSVCAWPTAIAEDGREVMVPYFIGASPSRPIARHVYATFRETETDLVETDQGLEPLDLDHYVLGFLSAGWVVQLELRQTTTPLIGSVTFRGVGIYRDDERGLTEVARVSEDDILEPGDAWPSFMATSTSDRVLVEVTRTSDLQLELLELEPDATLSPVRSFPVPGEPFAVRRRLLTRPAISSSGQTILADGGDRLTVYQQRRDGSWAATTHETGGHVQPTLSPDGSLLAWVQGIDPFDGETHRFTIADVRDDAIEERWTGQLPPRALPDGCADRPSPTALAFAPDGRLAVAGSSLCGYRDDYFRVVVASVFIFE